MWAYFCLPLQQNSYDLEDMDNQITSSQNPKVKRVTLLQQKSSERRKSDQFVVEGLRELRHCVSKGYEIESLFFCRSLLGESIDDMIVSQSYEVTPQVYEKIAYRDSTEGVVAVMRMKKGHRLFSIEEYKEGRFSKPSRYRTKNLPALGALPSPDDTSVQLSFI